MPYRFAKPTSHAFLAYGASLRCIKEAIEQWNPGGAITYKLDEFGEGWAYVNGKPYGYIDVGPVER